MKVALLVDEVRNICMKHYIEFQSVPRIVKLKRKGVSIEGRAENKGQVKLKP